MITADKCFHDNGKTWSDADIIVNGPRPGYYGFQNPEILVLKNGWIIWSSLAANFNYESYGTMQNSRRWLVTPQNIHGGAPYLIQLPSGQTILSCQYSGGRAIGSSWKKSTMTVFVGNDVATHFTNESYPWPNLPTDEGAYFSSLFLKDDSTIVLVTTRNFPDGHSEIWWKEGHLHP